MFDRFSVENQPCWLRQISHSKNHVDKLTSAYENNSLMAHTRIYQIFQLQHRCVVADLALISFVEDR